MKLITTFEDFLAEKLVAYKRKYTESYPAKTASTYAKVRNAVLSAVADGVITEDELQSILQASSHGSKWMSRNTDLFKITEDESGRKYALSKKGKRILKATSSC